MESRVEVPPGRVTHTATGLCTKKATISGSAISIRRCALHTSTEITGPSLRKKFFISVRSNRRARLWSPPGNGREAEARKGARTCFFRRTRKSVFQRRPVHAVLKPQPRPLPASLRRKAPRSHGQAVSHAERTLGVEGTVAPAALCCQKAFEAQLAARLTVQSWNGVGTAKRAEPFREEKTYRLVVRWKTLGRSGDRTRRQTGASSLGNGDRGGGRWRRGGATAARVVRVRILRVRVVRVRVALRTCSTLGLRPAERRRRRPRQAGIRA